MDFKNTTIKHINTKVLLFGGVYSNLQALEAIIETAERIGIAPEHCICTGDIIGYCAQPKETLERFKQWGAQSICGNVEIQLREENNNCGCDFKKGSRCDTFSLTWYPFAQSKLTKTHINYLHTLPEFITFSFFNRPVAVVHGSFFNTSEFIFKSTPWSVKAKTLNALEADIVIAGHCGLPFSQTVDNKQWVNPGVIGMPANNGTPEVWYAIMDCKENTITTTHYSLKYNYRKAQKLMENSLLPQAYAKTLSSGIWDNTEILPEIEAQLQGKPIFL